MHRSPRPGDLLLRGSLTEGFVLLDIASGEPVSAHNLGLMDALALAEAHPGALWQQLMDDRGRPLGEPFPALVSLQ